MPPSHAFTSGLSVSGVSCVVGEMKYYAVVD